jgi:hypothetical protein
METGLEPEQARTATTSGRGMVWPMLAAVLVMVTIVILPNAPVDLKVDADTSSSAVLNYAHQQGLQFGRDVVYLYGPLGYLLYFYFSPDSAVMRMVVDTVFCFAVAAGLCLVAWRLRLAGRCLLLGLFLFLAANAEPRTDLLIDTGLLCWGLLCFVESGRRLAVAVAAVGALAALGALAKTMVFVIGGLSVVLIAGDLAARGRWRLAAGMVAGFVVAIALGWMAAGQSLYHIVAWLTTSLTVAQSYSQCLGWEGLPQAMMSGLVVALMAMAMAILRVWSWPVGTRSTASPELPRENGTRWNASLPDSLQHPWWRRGLLLVWVVALLFLTWKHGFARADVFHVVYFLGFVPVLVVALEVLPNERAAARYWARGLGATCCVLSVFTLQSLFFPPGLGSLKQPLRLFGYHAACLLRPRDYQQRMSGLVECKRREAQLPSSRALIGRASVDVFGQHQIYALFNGLNYRPRPVFQSYVACSAPLMRLNETFYLSGLAPEYVMFSLGAIDRRFPPLEDAMVLRDLLFNYELVGAEDEFLLLKRKFWHSPRLKSRREGMVRPGERIDLRAFAGADLWLEIELKPTWLGRLRQVLYQPPAVRLAAWRKESDRLLARRRAPAPMLAAGFVASPLLMRNEDVLGRYKGELPSRPGSYSVELLPGEEHFWQNEAHFRIFQIVGDEASK